MLATTRRSRKDGAERTITLLEPGDKALVDSPGYYPLFGKLKLAKVEMLGVPRMGDGPDLEVLRGHLERDRPKVFFTQSLAHNPMNRPGFRGGSFT